MSNKQEQAFYKAARLRKKRSSAAVRAYENPNGKNYQKIAKKTAKTYRKFVKKTFNGVEPCYQFGPGWYYASLKNK